MKKRTVNSEIPSFEINDVFNITVPERREDSICWFKTAILNYETAKVLLSSNIICHSLFFMQQCVECIIKGILIENHLVDTNDIKEWGHYPECAFRIFYRSVNSQSEDLFNKIKEKIDKEENIECKLEMTNSILNAYYQKYEEIQSTPLTNCDIYTYGHLCVEVTMVSLSVLLGYMQQSTRYPDMSFRLPSELYDESEIVKRHSTVLLKRVKYVLDNVYL